MINMKLEIYKHQGRVNLNYAYIFVWVISIYPLDYLSKVMLDICCSLNIAFSLKRKKILAKESWYIESCRQKNIYFTDKVGQ